MERATAILWRRRIKKAILALATAALACIVLAWWFGYIVFLPPGDIVAVWKDRWWPAHRYGEPLRLVSPDGTKWFIPASWGYNPSHVCWYEKDGQRHEAGEFAPAEWDQFWYQAAVMLPSGRPVVVWCGGRKGPNALEPGHGCEVAASFYTGEGWTTPDIVARGVNPNGLDATVDKDGRVHVVFTAPLEPRETYGVLHGFYPGKAWHALYDDRQWTEAKPLQGRGHYNVDDPILTAAPSGRLILSARVHEEFSFFPYHTGVQVLDEPYYGRPGRMLPGLW